MLNPGTATGIPLAQRHSDSLFQDSKKLTAMNALLLSHCEPVKKKTRLKKPPRLCFDSPLRFNLQ